MLLKRVAERNIFAMCKLIVVSVDTYSYRREQNITHPHPISKVLLIYRKLPCGKRRERGRGGPIYL